MILNVLEYLDISAQRKPDKIAFSDQNNSVSFYQLHKQAKAIGSKIASLLQGQTNQPIGVFIDRNIKSLIAIIGVIYSGNFYVPIDFQLPQNRIELIIKTINPKAIILAQENSKAIDYKGFKGDVLSFDNSIEYPINEKIIASIRNKAIDTDPLYAIFTSGSTGIPKGVLISHRSVIDFIEHFSKIFNLSESCIFGNQAPFDFDVSVKDIYSTLKNGATLCIIPKILFSFPGKLIEYLNYYGVNTVIWATSALRIVENLKALEKETPRYLREIMFSGEVMPNRVLNYWRKHIPNAQYVNLYGPTEITCNCTYYKVDRPFLDSEPLPIGVPFPNTNILLLNEENKIARQNEIGEICIKGTSLALGYYNNPEETQRSFCQNPLNIHYPELIYRTGDLGKYNEKDELMFLSRKDFQIKHMGHRIELGEIEIFANALEFIDVACCLYDARNEKIILFYQASEKCDKEILIRLQTDLPKYMLPNRLIFFEHIPINKNSKVDRALLIKEFINEVN